MQKDDPSLMAQFYYADDELNMIAAELDSFDGRKDPERCTALVNQLRQCQDRVSFSFILSFFFCPTLKNLVIIWNNYCSLVK